VLVLRTEILSFVRYHNKNLDVNIWADISPFWKMFRLQNTFVGEL
jgi:hypothetical protein